MEYENLIDLIWISGFLFLLITLNVINKLIVRSIFNKPLGRQTIFDLLSQDTLFAMKFYGSFACLICIFARFNWFIKLLSDNPILLTVFCSIYSFAFVCLCVNASCLCIVRIMYIIKMSFVEIIGDFCIHLLSSTFTLFVGVTVLTILVIFEDINTESPVALLTRHIVPPGELLVEYLFTTFKM